MGRLVDWLVILGVVAVTTAIVGMMWLGMERAKHEREVACLNEFTYNQCLVILR